MFLFNRIGRRVVATGFAALTLAAALFAAIGHQSSASALTNCTVSDMTVDAEEARFLTLINTYRAQNGLGALAMSTNLNRAATWLAVDLATKNYFSHTDSLGRSPSTRAQNCDYPGGAGENIAAGTVRDTAQEAFDAWKASAGHNANMLNSSYKMIGISRYFGSGSQYGWYWVTDFGLVVDGTSGGGGTASTPTATPTGTSTSTPTPTPPTATTVAAAISSPAAGSTLPGATGTFVWNAAGGALEYFIYVGTSLGANNITGRSTALVTSTAVTSLPTNGSTVYVRLWTRFSTGWQYRDSTYKAAAAAVATPTPATSAKAAISSPAPGSTLPGTSATFNWTAGTGALEYFFYAGTTVGSNNIVGRSTGTSRSLAVANLPRGGVTVYVRLWTRFATGWQYTDYTFRAAP